MEAASESGFPLIASESAHQSKAGATTSRDAPVRDAPFKHQGGRTDSLITQPSEERAESCN